MRIRFKIKVLDGPRVVAEFEGRPQGQDKDHVTIGDILGVEQALERLTGYRVHVEEVELGK